VIAYAQPFPQVDGKLLKIFLRQKQSRTAGMAGGFFEDVLDDVLGGVAGLVEAIGDVLDAILQTVKQIGEMIGQILRVIVDGLNLFAIFDALADIFKFIGRTLVFLDASRFVTKWLKESKITGHIFNELDKFTGGMFTDAANTSTLLGRVMAGDNIPKDELIKDALFALKVVAIVFSGGSLAAVFVMVGSMAANEICSHQTENKDACKAAIIIASAAAGSYAQGLRDSSQSIITDEFADSYWVEDQIFASEGASFVPGNAAYNAGLESSAATATGAFLPHLTNAGAQYLNQVGIDAVTQQAMDLCQSGKWLGSNECRILSQVAGDYIQGGSDKEWDEFLGDEIAKIGASELLHQWFPPDSKEAIAIKRAWSIRYVDAPPVTVVNKQVSPMTLLLLAGGAAALIMGSAV